MKSKAKYALGMLVMPLLFPLCVLWSFILNLWSAIKECYSDTVYDMHRDWESLCRLYQAGFKQFFNKERP